MKLEKLQPGDVIFTDRFFYRHYGIYAGHGRIIHYSSSNGDFGNDACVRETSLKKFARGGECRIERFYDSQSNAQKFSREETVNRARSRMGEKSYNLLFNNCEHFVLWCKTGINKSVQVEKAAGTAILLGAAALVAHIAINSDNEGGC